MRKDWINLMMMLNLRELKKSNIDDDAEFERVRTTLILPKPRDIVHDGLFFTQLIYFLI